MKSPEKGREMGHRLRPWRRHLFTIGAASSIVLFVVTIGMSVSTFQWGWHCTWTRTHWRHEGQSKYEAHVAGGVIELSDYFADVDPIDPNFSSLSHIYDRMAGFEWGDDRSHFSLFHNSDVMVLGFSFSRRDHSYIATVPCWFVVLVSAVLPSVWIIRRRRKQTLTDDQCLTCGYNLTANASGVCPECGTADARKSDVGQLTHDSAESVDARGSHGAIYKIFPMRRLRIISVPLGSAVALVLLWIVWSVTHRHYADNVYKALLAHADAQPAPAPLATANYDSASTRLSSAARIVRAGSMQFNFPGDAMGIKVGAYEHNSSDKTPVSVIAHSMSGTISHTFDEAGRASEAQPTTRQPNALDIESDYRHWLVPAAAASELDIQCNASSTPENVVFIGATSDTLTAHMNSGFGEFFRGNAEIISNVIASGLASAGESKATATQDVDVALAGLRNLTDEAFFQRVFAVSESDLHNASKANEAAEIGLLLGSRWLEAPTYSLTRIASQTGNVYAVGRGAATMHEYFVEGFAPDGSYRWQGRIRVRAPSARGNEDVESIAQIVSPRP